MPRPLSHALLLGLAIGACFAPSISARVPGLELQDKQREENPALREVRQLMERQDMQAAEKRLRQLLVKDPENPDAVYLLGYALHVLGRIDDALLVDLRAAALPGRQRGVAFYNAACACALLGRADDAFSYLRKSQEHGFKIPKLVARDRDLDSLRGDPRLKEFLPPPISERPIFGPDVRVLYQLNGEHKGNAFGWAGRNAGDCDGDGVNDMLIAAPFFATKDSRSPAGRIYVISGATGKLIFQRTGEAGWRLGMSVESAGDVNNDGFSDIIVGADGNTREAGRAFVYSGKTGELIHALSEGSGADQFGRRVAGVGDIDGDGFDDLFVGAPANCTADLGKGSAYLFSGKDGSMLNHLEGEASGDGFGGSLCGRAMKQHAILAVGAACGGPQDRGRVYVYERRLGKIVLKTLLDADSQGAQMGETFLTILGDVNDDGELDLFTSDWKNNAKGPSTGRAYVFSAVTSKVLLTLTGEHRGDTFGAGPGRAGDVNHDGAPDLIIGAWRNSEGGLDAGKCTIFSGATGEVLRSIRCLIPASAFGFDATGMGDLDGDGEVDFLITAAHGDFNGKNSGSAFVILGNPLPAKD